MERNIHKIGKELFITSDEKIKVGDWFLGLQNQISKATSRDIYGGYELKIILTTDQELIKDGVQAIPNEFLEWFVKNPSCEEVKVEGHIYKGQDETEYKIIIPRLEKYSERFDNDKSPIGNPETWGKRMVEEPNYNMKQEIIAEMENKETLEEAAWRVFGKDEDNFYDGAKWQQERSYSEKEVKDIVDETIEKFYKHFYTLTKAEMKEQWFEQFKKK